MMTRRDFLRRSGYAGFAAAPLATWGTLQGISQLAAQGSGSGLPTDYRALVCLFLAGGNDSYGMLLPAPGSGFTPGTGWTGTDPAPQEWARYKALRAELALDQLYPASTPLHQAVLPLLKPDGSPYPQALHGRMPRLQAIFNGAAYSGGSQSFTPAGRHAAFLTNVGTLVEPGTAQQIRQALKLAPKQLQSHNDQILQWQTCFPQGSSSTGWAGRLADLAASSFSGTNQAFSMVSLDGVTPALIGSQVRHFTDAHGNGRVGLLLPGGVLAARRAALQGLLEEQRDKSQQTQVLSRAYAGSLLEGLDLNEDWNALVGQSSAAPVLPVSLDHGLTQKLRRIAKIIQVGREKAAAGATDFPRRQIFFLTLGGWDHHNGAATAHFAYLDLLDQALAEFYAQMQAQGALNAVTLFTASDFGRALRPNGDGTDHAWGGNQIALGGAVNGGNLYGQYPQLLTAQRSSSGQIIADSPGLDLTGNGTYIPTLSVDQYMQRMARWFLTGAVAPNDPSWLTESGSNWISVLPNWDGLKANNPGLLNGFMGI
jgi:uncharacterized protein (DUF1501 family)